MYKIFQDLDNIDKGILPMATYEGTRNQGNKTYRRYNRTNIIKHTFTNRIEEEWNSLPGEANETK